MHLRDYPFPVLILGVLVIMALVLPGCFSSAHAATLPAGTSLSANPLGLNVSPVDTAAANPATWARMAGYEKAVGPLAFRYGGGVRADATNWQDNRTTYKCPVQSALWTSPCSQGDPLSFQMQAANATAAGQSGMVTANYGTGTPALAADWAAYIKANHSPVTQIEIGNEPYGCSSRDLEITLPPVSDTAYQPGNVATCPYTLYGSGNAGIAKFAQSYEAWAPAFVQAVRAANPAIKVVLPYATTGHGAPVWNHSVMPTVKNWNALSVDWYPALAASIEDKAALVLPTQIPARAAVVKADLAKYGPGKPFVISEENVDNNPIATTCHPASAVFAAGSALEWLAQGAQSVNWWTQSDNNNPGSPCSVTDFSMFSGNGTPQYPYYGWLMASKLAQPHAVLSYVKSGNSKVLAFHATLRGGHQAVAYINITTGTSIKVPAPPLPKGNLVSWKFSNAHAKVTKGKTTEAALKNGVMTAPDSITIYSS